MKDFAQGLRNINREKKSEKRERKTFELIQFPVEMKKVPQSWKASFYPVLFGNHSLTCFSKSTLIFSLRENVLRWQLDVSQPFVYFWLQSPQEGKQIYFLNIVWYAEYTDLFFLQSECQICLPCEQCGGISETLVKEKSKLTVRTDSDG